MLKISEDPTQYKYLPLHCRAFFEECDPVIRGKGYTLQKGILAHEINQLQAEMNQCWMDSIGAGVTVYKMRRGTHPQIIGSFPNAQVDPQIQVDLEEKIKELNNKIDEWNTTN